MPAVYQGSDFSFFKNLATNRFEDTVGFSMVESYKNNNTITCLEYHRKTKEVIIPVQNDVILILSNGTDTPDIDNAQALLLKQGDGFIIDEGVWHYAPLTMHESSKIFIIFVAHTPDNDVYKVDLYDTFNCVLGI